MADAGGAPAPKPTSSVKLVLLGESAVGKSSLVLRFVNNDFQENKEPTIGAAFLTQKATLPTRTIKFEIWDTAGQERFASLAPMYYRNAQAALVVYDLTKASSLVKARHWVAELQRQASPGIVIGLCGNKRDLVEGEGEDAPTEETGESTEAQGEGEGAEGGAESGGNENGNGPSEDLQRKVSTAEARAFAEEEGLLFFETSAKTGGNVSEVFAAIAQSIPETALKGRGTNPAAGGAGGGAGAGGAGGAGGVQEASAGRVDLGRGQQGGAGGGKEGCAC